MIEKYRDAFAEVNEILRYFNSDLLKKIPREIIENIRNNMSTSYMVMYDNTKGLNEQDLKQETRAILSIIYRDYICNENIRAKIIQKDRKELIDLEEKKKKKYGNIELFKTSIPTIGKNTALKVIEEQNIITRIIKKIKHIWRKIHG